MFDDDNQRLIENILSNESGTDIPSLGFDTNELQISKMQFIENLKNKISTPIEHSAFNIKELDKFPPEVKTEIQTEMVEYYVNYFKIDIEDIQVILTNSDMVDKLFKDLFSLLTDKIFENIATFIGECITTDGDFYYDTLVDKDKVDLDNIPLKYIQNNKLSKKTVINLINLDELLANREIAKIAFCNTNIFIELYKHTYSFLGQEQENLFLENVLDLVFNSELFLSILYSRVKLQFLAMTGDALSPITYEAGK